MNNTGYSGRIIRAVRLVTAVTKRLFKCILTVEPFINRIRLIGVGIAVALLILWIIPYLSNKI